MRAIGRLFATLSVLAAPLMLAACGEPAPLYVDRAWIRMNPNPQSPSAGYFTIHGGEAPVQLLGVLADRAMRIEMHESVEQNGVMTMQPVQSVDVAARTDVTFAPGGKHIMLWGINPQAVTDGKMPLTFLFSNGDRIIVDAVIRKAGAAATSADGDNAAEHPGH